MQHTSKYVVLLESSGRELPIVFPDSLAHADLVAGMQLNDPTLKVVAAGYMVNTNGDFTACGCSPHLGLACRQQDEKLLSELLSEKKQTPRQATTVADILGAPRRSSQVLWVNMTKKAGGVVLTKSEL